MNEKDQFLKNWEREYQVTTKVLQAYPTDKMAYRPHERSRSAQELAWAFVGEEAVMDSIIKGAIDFSAAQQPAPSSLDEILAAYQKVHKQMFDQVKNMSEQDYQSEMQFPVGPNQMGNFRRADVLWILLMDAIHHRGQFSVYLRLAGGKVPSIYGPSADEPWM
jgi:uncharacterized damage-inducible protein DinB